MAAMTMMMRILQWLFGLQEFPRGRNLAVIGCVGLACALGARGADTAAFDEANKLYSAGKFAEAASAYKRILSNGPPAAVVWFNLGNARFKAGQFGRAIAAYHQARRLDPRDADIRFNLKFVRQKVTGTDALVGTVVQRLLAALTLNEWTLFTAAAFWALFFLLALREARSMLRRTLRIYAALCAVLTVVLAGGTVAAYDQERKTTAVVVVTEAVVRNGPLDISPVAFQLRDGSEVIVKDEQEVTDQGRRQTWFQVQDAARRIGWLKRDQLILLK